VTRCRVARHEDSSLEYALLVALFEELREVRLLLLADELELGRRESRESRRCRLVCVRELTVLFCVLARWWDRCERVVDARDLELDGAEFLSDLPAYARFSVRFFSRNASRAAYLAADALPSANSRSLVSFAFAMSRSHSSMRSAAAPFCASVARLSSSS
jgi:hypothetical protein